MIRQILATGATLAISLAALACSGGDGPTQGGDPSGPQPAAGETTETQTQAQAQAQAQAPALTRPKRLDFTPTRPAPETGAPATGTGPKTRKPPGPTQPATETAQPAATAQSPADGRQTPAANTPPPGDPSPEDLIPRDPRTNDRVLLQDIYARMDLEQFALDPNEPIALPIQASGGMGRFGYPDMWFRYFETRDHPYLHLFPGLRNSVNMARGKGYDSRAPDETIEYNPYNPPGHWDGDAGDDYNFHGGITHFIYHPWFEPLRGTEMNDAFRFPETGSGETRRLALGPHWFGSHSLRGTLAKAVAEGLEQARTAGVEDRPIPWRINHEGNREWRRDDRTYENRWSLEQYLRTPVFRDDGVKYLEKSPTSSLRGSEMDIMRDAYKMPAVQWEFLHHKLPIIRVTAYNKTILPLAPPGQEQGETQFAVSFVISFQNRWASFDDPNRWLIRFEEDLLDNFRLLNDKHTAAEAETEFHDQNFPGYWHESDYMQHRLIGPVVVQVYETSSKNNRVMDPGIYAVTPGVTEWETPGPILRDDRQLSAYGHQELRPKASPTQTISPLRTRAITKSSNPGWPLPGHVMTNAATGPGTKVWERSKLDGHEW